jgi:hypothetical protein
MFEVGVKYGIEKTATVAGAIKREAARLAGEVGKSAKEIGSTTKDVLKYKRARHGSLRKAMKNDAKSTFRRMTLGAVGR